MFLALVAVAMLGACSDDPEIEENAEACLVERCGDLPALAPCFEATTEIASCDQYCADSGQVCSPEECNDPSVSYGTTGKGRCEYENMDFATEITCDQDIAEGAWIRCCCGEP